MRLAWLLVLLAACQPASEHVDILIRGGTVHDGSLNDGKQVDLGIRDGRITIVDPAAHPTADRIIDASSLLVTPGFIDPHTHATNTLRSPETNANLNYLAQGVTTVFIGNDGYGVSKRDETLALFDKQGIGTNVATLVGHGQVRKAVMGMAARPAEPAEIAAMQSLVDAQMKDGSFGLSTGLFYAPGSYSTTDEVVALARTAAANGGIYDTHMRSESSHADGLLAAVDETVTVAREAGIPTHISHLKALGKDVWDQHAALIGKIRAARDEGLNVTANQYPWRASGTRFSNALVPRWVMADSKDRMRERLQDDALLPGIRDEMALNLERRGGPDAMIVSAADSPWRGMTLTGIASAMETDLVSAAIRVVIDGDPSIASFVMDPDIIDAIAVEPWVMTGSDGSSGHPRLYGTYPKAWADFVKTGLMSVSRFVHRSSGQVADTFGLCDRGYLRDGAIADIAIIDAERFRANASYESPTELSDGVAFLLVNGVIVIDNNNYTGELPGKVLRHTGCND